jgi:hypothetical protein
MGGCAVDTGAHMAMISDVCCSCVPSWHVSHEACCEIHVTHWGLVCMPCRRHILVAIDNSSNSRHALEWAATHL